MRLALGISYNGAGYNGWQSQSDGNTIQDQLERALHRFTTTPIRTICSGRTDSNVHAVMQVVHLDTSIDRTLPSWVRGTNSFLPSTIAVQWARHVSDDFHARGCALNRKYCYLLLQSPVRPSLETGRVGWVHTPLDLSVMKTAAQYLIGTHDFSSFRAAACQALTPVKTLTNIKITQRQPTGERPGDAPCYWQFEFEGNAFLHHMIRNMMGCLITIGRGDQPASWMHEVLLARSRKIAAPTFSPYGLYFLGPEYAPCWQLPPRAPAYDWLL